MKEKGEVIIENCPFCTIIDAQGNDPHQERIFFDHQGVMAMFVNHPDTHGHFIVFPSSHASDLPAMKDDLGEFFRLVCELAESAIPKLGADAYVLKLNNNIYKLDDDPLHVGHIHMHVIPHYKQPVPLPKVIDSEYYQEVMQVVTE
ncbi:MAG: HIT family protein [Candidatus Roizmanbacteria bacterium]